jgi:hypothetical protein
MYDPDGKNPVAHNENCSDISNPNLTLHQLSDEGVKMALWIEATYCIQEVLQQLDTLS